MSSLLKNIKTVKPSSLFFPDSKIKIGLLVKLAERETFSTLSRFHPIYNENI